ncbi:MAG: beta-glucosidase [Treponema sp.]|jgi:beta-glucosidase|nr:beta-glucosidase [Treponema sp.]
MPKLDFPQDFLWGASTASYQVEGATHEGGRSESIWDSFSRRVGGTYAGENGDVTCDQYHRYAEDVTLLASFGFKSYRFSLAWPRILPQGTGPVNKEGVQYYRNLCAELHAHNIQACATLYHWDLPQCLQDKGGWTERTIVELFKNYATVCFEELGDCVDQWITINEPQCVAYLGHLTGHHAPGIVGDVNLAAKTVHHINLAHGAAVKVYREKAFLKAPIGTALNINTPRPATLKPEDIQAAQRARTFEAEVFLLPLLGKGYPDLSPLGLKLPLQPGDLELIAQPIDFIGINYYFEHAVQHDPQAERTYSNAPFWQNRSDMGWPIIPAGLERQLLWVHEVSGGLPLYITENGYAAPDTVVENRVHDYDRINYLKKHLAVCADLIKRGVPLKGYYVWSLLDNFEWGYGFTKRFGIVYVDYTDQKRIPKDSAYFFRDLIAGYGDY